MRNKIKTKEEAGTLSTQLAAAWAKIQMEKFKAISESEPEKRKSKSRRVNIDSVSYSK